MTNEHKTAAVLRLASLLAFGLPNLPSFRGTVWCQDQHCLVAGPGERLPTLSRTATAGNLGDILVGKRKKPPDIGGGTFGGGQAA